MLFKVGLMLDILMLCFGLQQALITECSGSHYLVQKSKPNKSQAEKLSELELSGLVEFDKSHARQAHP